MARNVQQRKAKKIIYVFWEGESEKAYSIFLNKEFGSHAKIKPHRKNGTFDTARASYRKDRAFTNDVEELDEIWFFFDTEASNGDQLDNRMKRLKDIITSRKKNPIKIRLLMSSGCIEYWFLLHYERTQPLIVDPPGKERVLKKVQQYVPTYKKGDQRATDEIAKNYKRAVENGRWTLDCLKQVGMPEEEEQRNRWLFRGEHTFTTVHEVVEMLMSLIKALFKIFCKHDFCDEIRDSKIQESEAAAPFLLR